MDWLALLFSPISKKPPREERPVKNPQDATEEDDVSLRKPKEDWSVPSIMVQRSIDDTKKTRAKAARILEEATELLESEDKDAEDLIYHDEEEVA